MNHRLPLYSMALGAFAIGTEPFMVAAVLPDIARDLAVSNEAAGYLVSVFALAYAISSPVLTALTARVPRRLFLLCTMLLFGAGNLFAARAASFQELLVARVLLAVTASIFVPNASALAGSIVAKVERGRALSLVTSGLSLAIVFGVPLGAIVGDRFGWRATFSGVALLALVATAGLFFGIPRDIGQSIAIPTLKARLAAIGQRNVRGLFIVTMLWAIGPFVVYPYLAIYLHRITSLADVYVSVVLFAWGISAYIGLAFGGSATDRFGGDVVVMRMLPLLAMGLACLSVVAMMRQTEYVILPVLVAVSLWGFSAWAWYPAQQARLVERVGPEHGSVVLSANASFHYLGFSVGATLGSLLLARASVVDLGWVGAGIVFVAYGLERFSRKQM